jgi:hypothetical protein
MEVCHAAPTVGPADCLSRAPSRDRVRPPYDRAAAPALPDGGPQLESDEVIKDFAISYVTHGKLNANRSNAILMVTAISGNHLRIGSLIGPGRAVDHWLAGGVFPADVEFLNRQIGAFLDVVTARGRRLQ